MRFPYGFDKVPDFALLPDGKWFPFRIVETEDLTSKKGHPMVKIVAQCLDPDPEHKGQEVWHYVTFIPENQKGAGIAKHFVKCLGFPVDKTYDVDSDEWIGKPFMGKIIHEAYNGKKNHKFSEISPIQDDSFRDAPKKEDDPFGN